MLAVPCICAFFVRVNRLFQPYFHRRKMRIEAFDFGEDFEFVLAGEEFFFRVVEIAVVFHEVHDAER